MLPSFSILSLKMAKNPAINKKEKNEIWTTVGLIVVTAVLVMGTDLDDSARTLGMAY